MEPATCSSSRAISEFGHVFLNCLVSKIHVGQNTIHKEFSVTYSSFALSPRSLHSFAAARQSLHRT